jgi:hypothetical protein
MVRVNTDMPIKKQIVDEVTATPDDGNEKDIEDDSYEDCGDHGEDGSDVEADGEWITIRRNLFHPENKITASEAQD